MLQLQENQGLKVMKMSKVALDKVIRFLIYRSELNIMACLIVVYYYNVFSDEF